MTPITHGDRDGNGDGDDYPCLPFQNCSDNTIARGCPLQRPKGVGFAGSSGMA